MIYNEKNTNKGQWVKLKSFRKMCKDDEDAAQAMMTIYMNATPAVVEDKVAIHLEEGLAKLFPAGLNLGVKGYSIKRSKGKGASGFVASKIE